MSTIITNCDCGRQFTVKITGEDFFTCPNCKKEFQRLFNQKDDNYEIIERD